MESSVKKNIEAKFKWSYILMTVAVIVLPIIYICWYTCWISPTTVLLVRHADRVGSTDALNPAGVVRTQDLAHLMEKSGIRAIYQSDTTRSRQTAAPTATALGITPLERSAADVAGLVNDIRANHAGQKVLVVGHSNTVPQIISALGGPAVTISENEFDNLYVLTLCHCFSGEHSLINLQYGVPSP